MSDTKLAIKSGFGKYLGLTNANKVAGRSDAITSREQWEPVFQEVQYVHLLLGIGYFRVYDKRGVVFFLLNVFICLFLFCKTKVTCINICLCCLNG